MDQITLTVIEIVIGIIVEGVILSMVFAYIANQQSEKQNQQLKQEMSIIENQNRFEFEQVLLSLENAKTEIISQIKETGGKIK